MYIINTETIINKSNFVLTTDFIGPELLLSKKKKKAAFPWNLPRREQNEVHQ